MGLSVAKRVVLGSLVWDGDDLELLEPGSAGSSSSREKPRRRPAGEDRGTVMQGEGGQRWKTSGLPWSCRGVDTRSNTNTPNRCAPLQSPCTSSCTHNAPPATVGPGPAALESAATLRTQSVPPRPKHIVETESAGETFGNRELLHQAHFVRGAAPRRAHGPAKAVHGGLVPGPFSQDIPQFECWAASQEHCPQMSNGNAPAAWQSSRSIRSQAVSDPGCLARGMSPDPAKAVHGGQVPGSFSQDSPRFECWAVSQEHCRQRSNRNAPAAWQSSRSIRSQAVSDPGCLAQGMSPDLLLRPLGWGQSGQAQCQGEAHGRSSAGTACARLPALPSSSATAFGSPSSAWCCNSLKKRTKDEGGLGCIYSTPCEKKNSKGEEGGEEIIHSSRKN
eukprot:RCo000974